VPQVIAEQQEKAVIEVGKEAGAEMVCATMYWLFGISVLKEEGKEQCGKACPLCG
jgi:hypothetical protein